MKKTLYFFAFICSMSIFAQKKFAKILQSVNIQEIENFMKEGHPNDARKMILKRKLVTLKNASWMRSGISSFKTTNLEIQRAPPLIMSQSPPPDEEEFRQLIATTSAEHKAKTVRLLNQLFDSNNLSDEAILLIQNRGDCNLIVRILGKENYNLAVPAKGENFVVVKKGEYQLSSTFCNFTYNSGKSILKNLLVTLNKGDIKFLDSKKDSDKTLFKN